MDDGPLSVFPRALHREFIEMYKREKCLWDRSCWSYKDKKLKDAALQRLTSLVNDQIPDTTKIHVLRKIESMRACYRRERKKVVASKKKNGRAYVPRLWYYELFNFLEDNDKGTDESINDVDSEEESGEVNESQEETIYENPHSSRDYNVFNVEYAEAQDRLITSDNDNNYSRKRPYTEIADEYDAIGINVAAKLRSLPLNMRIIAEKLINDILFQAQINGLTPTSAIVTHDPIAEMNSDYKNVRKI